MTHNDLFPIKFPKQAYLYGQRSDGEVHGVVLTKAHIVDLILDLAGWKSDSNILGQRLLEPSCGHGAFLLPAVRRLLQALKHSDSSLSSLKDSIAAFDIDEEHVAITKKRLTDLIVEFGHKPAAARALVDGWIFEGDFLLADLKPNFNVVVGNPPYIRIEQIAPELHTEYRRRFTSLFDRADLYVAFIEKCLDLLSENGRLSFICADRWILNKYGAPLRQKVTTSFEIHSYIDLHQASPFDSDVIAYPSIFVIGRGKTKGVNVFGIKEGSEEDIEAVRAKLAGKKVSSEHVSHGFYESWFSGDEPWTLSSPEQLATLRQLESKFQPIESDGETKIKIGVATGCDRIFIVPEDLDVEKSRILPLVMRDDLENGRIKHSGKAVINAFGDDGKIIDLNDYPKLKKYFTKHAEDIQKRHVAKNNEKGWFRTIDRVYPEIVGKPKLLIPDIAGSNEVTLDKGKYFPHHNLYYVVSDSWDLSVLGGLLSSRVALFFVWSYAVKMRGGYLRFQAQYLRRIRVPAPGSISKDLAHQIKDAFKARDFLKLDQLSMKAYGLKELPEFDFVDTRK